MEIERVLARRTGVTFAVARRRESKNEETTRKKRNYGAFCVESSVEIFLRALLIFPFLNVKTVLRFSIFRAIE